MRYLCIDTSVGAGAAILDDSQKLCERHSVSSRHHAESTVQLIEQCATDLGYDKISDVGLDAIVVGRGPAPFTGLRVGLVVARTLGFALNIPVYGLCSLDAIAYAGAQQLDIQPGQNFMVLTDARRKEVYCRVYTMRGDATKANIGATGDPKVMDPVHAVDYAQESACISLVYPSWEGEECEAHYVDTLQKALPENLSLNKTTFQVADLGHVFYDNYVESGAELPTSTQPLYLRRPDIQGQPR